MKFYLTVHGVLIGRISYDKIMQMLESLQLDWEDRTKWIAGCSQRGYGFIGENQVVRIDYRYKDARGE